MTIKHPQQLSSLLQAKQNPFLPPVDYAWSEAVQASPMTLGNPMPTKPAIIHPIHTTKRHLRPRTLGMLCSFLCYTAGSCHQNPKLTDRNKSMATSFWGTRAAPFLLLSKNLNVCLLHHVRGSIQTFTSTIIFLLKFCLCWWSSRVTLLALLSDIAQKRWQLTMPLLTSSCKAIRAVCTKKSLPFAGHCRLYTKHVAASGGSICNTSSNSMTKRGSALFCFHRQLPKWEHEYSIAAAMLRHKLYPPLAVTLSNKTASGSTIQLEKAEGQAFQGTSPSNPAVQQSLHPLDNWAL